MAAEDLSSCAKVSRTGPGPLRVPTGRIPMWFVVPALLVADSPVVLAVAAVHGYDILVIPSVATAILAFPKSVFSAC